MRPMVAGAAFVAPAVDLGIQLNARVFLRRVKSAAALGAVNFVTRKREQIDAVRLHVDGDFSRGLHGVSFDPVTRRGPWPRWGCPPHRPGHWPAASPAISPGRWVNAKSRSPAGSTGKSSRRKGHSYKPDAPWPGASTTWLNGVWTSWAAILVADAWKNTPFLAILLLAGLQIIPDDLYEQARIDGAGVVRRFLFITLPMLKPAILVALIFRTLSSFLIFDIVYVMTGGGPGSATETLGFINWRAFLVDVNFGYGGAISVLLIVISVLIALVYQRVLRPST